MQKLELVLLARRREWLGRSRFPFFFDLDVCFVATSTRSLFRASPLLNRPVAHEQIGRAVAVIRALSGGAGGRGRFG